MIGHSVLKRLKIKRNLQDTNNRLLLMRDAHLGLNLLFAGYI
jgi:hypothetical protein